jgi:hypothetical protein
MKKPRHNVPRPKLLPALTTSHAPALIRAAGDRAQTRFWEFFVSNIRNPHTRRAYGRSIAEFLAWQRARSFTHQKSKLSGILRSPDFIGL